MDQLRARAIEMIRGQHRVDRLTKRCKLLMLLVVAGSFFAGLVVGLIVPYDIKVSPKNQIQFVRDPY